MRSQTEQLFAWIYQGDKKCLGVVEKVKNGVITPNEAARLLWRQDGDKPLLCFLFLLRRRHPLAVEICRDLRHGAEHRISVSEATEVAEQDFLEECREILEKEDKKTETLKC